MIFIGNFVELILVLFDLIPNLFDFKSADGLSPGMILYAPVRCHGGTLIDANGEHQTYLIPRDGRMCSCSPPDGDISK